MASASKRKPWPDIAAEEYIRLVALAEGLIQLMTLLFDKAVFGRHNPLLLEKLLDILPSELKRMQHIAVLANRKRRQQTKERFPKWVVAALEDAIALTEKMVAGVGRLREGYEADNWSLIEEMTIALHDQALRLQDLILSGPPPERPVDEIVELANKFWEEWGKEYD